MPVAIISTQRSLTPVGVEERPCHIVPPLTRIASACLPRLARVASGFAARVRPSIGWIGRLRERVAAPSAAVALVFDERDRRLEILGKPFGLASCNYSAKEDASRSSGADGEFCLRPKTRRLTEGLMDFGRSTGAMFAARHACQSFRNWPSDRLSASHWTSSSESAGDLQAATTAASGNDSGL